MLCPRYGWIVLCVEICTVLCTSKAHYVLVKRRDVLHYVPVKRRDVLCYVIVMRRDVLCYVIVMRRDVLCYVPVKRRYVLCYVPCFSLFSCTGTLLCPLLAKCALHTVLCCAFEVWSEACGAQYESAN
jgi:hypothetical protein